MKLQFWIIAVLTIASCKSRSTAGREKMEDSSKIKDDSTDGKVMRTDSPKVLIVGDSVIINYLGATITIEGNQIIPIQNDSPKSDEFLLHDFDENGVPELAVLIDDLTFGGRSHFRVFRYELGNLRLINFKTRDDSFDELVIRNKFCYVTKKGHIFGYTTNVPGKDGEELWQIDKYIWNADEKLFNYSGSKTFSEEKLPDSIQGVVF